MEYHVFSGEEICLRKDLKVRAFRTYHVIPSQVISPFSLIDALEILKCVSVVCLNCSAAIFSIQYAIYTDYKPCVFMWLYVPWYDGMLCPHQFSKFWIMYIWVVGDLQGYIVYSIKHKLKQEYIGLPAEDIKKLKSSCVEVCCNNLMNRNFKQQFTNILNNQSNTTCHLVNSRWMTYFLSFWQITNTVTTPEIAFTGDTMSDFILDNDNIDVLRARILIVEVDNLICNILIVNWYPGFFDYPLLGVDMLHQSNCGRVSFGFWVSA